MIYDKPSAEDPIRQGDIFRWIPSTELSLATMACVDKDGKELERTSWNSLVPLSPGKELYVLVPVRAFYAIAVSQDCDAVRSQYITFCEIRPFMDVQGGDPPKDAKGWMNLLTKQARVNWKWFYLPPDDALGFAQKMAVDFRSVTKVDRVELESLLSQLRVGRLNEIALAHFRERISDFFRRYAYNEWYPLDHAELQAYVRGCGDVEPVYDWQKPKTGA